MEKDFDTELYHEGLNAVFNLAFRDGCTTGTITDLPRNRKLLTPDKVCVFISYNMNPKEWKYFTQMKNISIVNNRYTILSENANSSRK